MTYLNIPIEEWEILQSKAEEALIEEGIGQHILGFYPYGDILLKDKTTSISPDLICLYLDCSIGYLDPFYNKKGKNPVLHISNSMSKVYYINIKDFISDLTSPSSLHSSVCFGDILYQDDSVDLLLSLVQEYLTKNNSNEELKNMKERIKKEYINFIKFLF